MLPMIHGLRDHERYVYHYTKLSTAPGVQGRPQPSFISRLKKLFSK
jgi:hypothetical protein